MLKPGSLTHLLAVACRQKLGLDRQSLGEMLAKVNIDRI